MRKMKKYRFSFKRFMNGLGAVLVLLALWYAIGVATIDAIPKSPVLKQYITKEVSK